MGIDMEQEAIIFGPPTHYTSTFDDVGRPMAVSEFHESIAGELPTGWDDSFWDWTPRFDPKGQWVQLVDPKRDAVWAQVKANRADALCAGIETSAGRIQVDEGSMAALRGRAQRLLLPAAPAAIEWTMADNTVAKFTKDEFLSVVAAAEDFIDSIHTWSQNLRQTIYGASTLEELKSVDLVFQQGK